MDQVTRFNGFVYTRRGVSEERIRDIPFLIVPPGTRVGRYYMDTDKGHMQLKKEGICYQAGKCEHLFLFLRSSCSSPTRRCCYPGKDRAGQKNAMNVSSVHMVHRL